MSQQSANSPVGTKVMLLLKAANEPLNKTDLLNKLGVDKMDKTKQNSLKLELNMVLDAAVKLGFITKFEDYFVPATHPTDMVELLGFNETSQSDISLSPTVDTVSTYSDSVEPNMEMGTKLIHYMKSVNMPLKKSDLLNMMGVEQMDMAEQAQAENEIDKVLKDAVNLGFVQTIEDHFIPATHILDVYEILEKTENNESNMSIISIGSSIESMTKKSDVDI